MGYDFYGQRSDWSDIQTLNMSETSVSPSTTVPSALPSQDSTPAQTTEPTPSQTTEPTTNETPQIPQSTAIIGLVVAVVVVSAGLLVYFKKRKPQSVQDCARLGER
jgi:hypothetical protein